MKRTLTRRRFVHLSGGALAVSLAGCLGSLRNESPFSTETEIDDSSPIESRDDATIVEDPTAEVRADGDVIVLTDFELSGNILAAGSVVIEEDADVDGSIDADEHVLLERGADVNYDVRAGGRVVCRSDTEVHGSVDADGDVLLRDDAFVDGTLEAGGDVVLQGSSEVGGDVTGRSVGVAVTAGVRGTVHETG